MGVCVGGGLQWSCCCVLVLVLKIGLRINAAAMKISADH